MKYKYVVAWGRLLGLPSSAIRKLAKRAHKENAPPDAMAPDIDGTWIRFGTLTSPLGRKLIQTVVDSL